MRIYLRAVSFLSVLSCLLVGGSMVWGASAPQNTVHPVKVTVDGQLVSFHSVHVDASIPALLVDGHAMLPVRFFDEVLGTHLDLHLQPWDIVQLGNEGEAPYAFKLGERAAYTSMPGVGGDHPVRETLPIAPRMINGRFYIPAKPTVTLLGHAIQWDEATQTLAITK